MSNPANYRVITSRQPSMFRASPQRIGTPKDARWATSRIVKAETPEGGYAPLRVWTLCTRKDGKAVKVSQTTSQYEAALWCV